MNDVEDLKIMINVCYMTIIYIYMYIHATFSEWDNKDTLSWYKSKLHELRN